MQTDTDSDETSVEVEPLGDAQDYALWVSHRGTDMFNHDFTVMALDKALEWWDLKWSKTSSSLFASADIFFRPFRMRGKTGMRGTILCKDAAMAELIRRLKEELPLEVMMSPVRQFTRMWDVLVVDGKILNRTERTINGRGERALEADMEQRLDELASGWMPVNACVMTVVASPDGALHIMDFSHMRVAFNNEPPNRCYVDKTYRVFGDGTGVRVEEGEEPINIYRRTNRFTVEVDSAYFLHDGGFNAISAEITAQLRKLHLKLG